MPQKKVCEVCKNKGCVARCRFTKPLPRRKARIRIQKSGS